MTGAIISVWGPTGAPGRTSLSINVATELSLAGRSVALVDADTYGGSVAGYLELFDEAPGFLATCRLADAEKFDDAHLERLSHRVVMGTATLTVFTGTTNPGRWPELSPARVRAGMAALAERFEFVVIDCGFNLEEDEEIASDLLAPRRNQATVSCLRASSVIIAVASAEVVGLARYIHALDQLAVIAEEASIVHVVNRIRRQGIAVNAGQTVRNTLYRFAGLEQVHLIDEDVSGFHSAMVAAVPLRIANPKSPVVAQVATLTSAVVEAAATDPATVQEFRVPAAG